MIGVPCTRHKQTAAEDIWAWLDKVKMYIRRTHRDRDRENASDKGVRPCIFKKSCTDRTTTILSTNKKCIKIAEMCCFCHDVAGIFEDGCVRLGVPSNLDPMVSKAALDLRPWLAPGGLGRGLDLDWRPLTLRKNLFLAPHPPPPPPPRGMAAQAGRPEGRHPNNPDEED